MVGRTTIRIDGQATCANGRSGTTFLDLADGVLPDELEAAATLLDLVLRARAGPAPLRMLDLYAGSGLFALALARAAIR